VGSSAFLYHLTNLIHNYVKLLRYLFTFKW